MSSGGKGKMKNLASFIRENFNIVGNSILVVVLLGLEKLMDLEFNCPADKPLAIVYSLVFLIVPTAMVLLVGCYLSPQGMCCKGNSTEIKAGAEKDNVGSESFQILEMSEQKTEPRNAMCRCCSETLQGHFFAIKATVFWILIVVTDGRYLGCFVKSVDELRDINNSNSLYSEPPLSWTEVRDNYLIHLIQIIGLILILLLLMAIVCFETKVTSVMSSFGWKSESESERCRKMNRDILLQITEDTLQEEARQRQKEFVVTLLRREDWASYNPVQPNALEELGKIKAKWKGEVKRQLEGAEMGRAILQGGC
ncbi:uncharacterized protein ACMZJ9_011627 [Mantella aurantiaca]